MIEPCDSATNKPAKSPRVQQREARLKTALKANMAKRKAQMRGRSEPDPDNTADDPNEKE